MKKLFALLLFALSMTAEAQFQSSWISNSNYLYGTTDPTGTSVNAPIGTIYFKTDGTVYTKLDDGYSTNWLKMAGQGSNGTFSRVYAGNGTLALPSLTFTNQTDSGLYRVGSNEIAISIVGNQALDFTKSTSNGTWGNVGMGGSGSLSGLYPLLIQRDIAAGLINIQVGNPDTAAGSGAKVQVASDNGGNILEVTSVTSATAAPDIYAGGGGVIRLNSSGSEDILRLVSDTDSSALIKFYVAGDASGNEVGRFSSTKFILENGEHLDSVGTTPGTTPQTSLGSTGTCSVSHGTDDAGIVTLTPGGSGIASGAQCFINFAVNYGAAPICTVTPTVGTDYADSVNAYLSATTAHLVINFAGAPTSAHVYAYNYHCIETQ